MFTVTSREFNQDLGEAKKASEKEPVFITNRGQASHVLMSYDHYKSILGKKKTIGELLSMPGAEDTDLPLARDDKFSRDVDFS